MGLAGRVADLIETYLLVWVLAAVSLGVLLPDLAGLTPFTTAILAVMIGSISLTLSPAAFRAVRGRALVTILLVQTGMPVVAFLLARALSLSPELTLGFVVLGAVTPELVAPVMTDLAGGDTALATTALVLVGAGTLGLVPAAVTLLAGASGRTLDTWPIVEGLLLAVVVPMTTAVAARAAAPERVGRYDDYYPAISATMVVLVIGIVTAANATLLRTDPSLVALVGVGALALNLVGYAGGWLATAPFAGRERIAGTFSVGMRDFAVAAGVLVGAGFPTAAALPAVVFGVLEMATSAALVRRFQKSRS